MVEVTNSVLGHKRRVKSTACRMESRLEADPATSSRGLGATLLLGKEPECNCEECMGAWGAKAQRLERAWHVPKLYGGVGQGRAGGCLVDKGTQYHMVGHRCTKSREASGPEVAIGRYTPALSQQEQKGSGRE